MPHSIVGAEGRAIHNGPTWLEPVLDANESAGIHIPVRFIEAVALHVFFNLLPTQRAATALFLAIVGVFGSGKTGMLRECLRRLGVHVVELAATALTSRYEGEPAERIDGFYLQAARHQAQHRQPSAFIIQDLETALGNFEQYGSGTMNIQHANGALMALADSPCCVRGEQCPRVPVFITGNRVGTLYKGLTEPHRMRTFEWRPTQQERRQIIRHMFKKILPGIHIDWLILMKPDWSFARFNALANLVEQERILRSIEHQPIDVTLRQAVQAPQSLNLDAASNGNGYTTLQSAMRRVEASDAAVRTDYAQNDGRTTA